jgi:glutathione S-transferase
MQLYEFPPTRSIRARWVLQELGVPFESHRVDLQAGDARTPDFLKLNKASKIPVLVDGSNVVTESVAIVVYLAEKYPEKKLFPSDLVGRSQANRWMLFVATELEQPLWRMAKHTVLYPEADRIPAEIELAKRDFREMIPVLEEHLAGRDFMIGDAFGVVDAVTAYTLDWANLEGLLDGAPRCRAYMERMYQRPKAAMRIRDAFASVGMAIP